MPPVWKELFIGIIVRDRLSIFVRVLLSLLVLRGVGGGGCGI